jgi:hypothetical protein
MQMKIKLKLLKVDKKAQAVSLRVPMAAARVPSYVKSCEICGGQCKGRFPLSTSVSPANPHSTNCSMLIYYQRLTQ